MYHVRGNKLFEISVEIYFFGSKKGLRHDLTPRKSQTAPTFLGWMEYRAPQTKHVFWGGKLLGISMRQFWQW